MCFVTVVVQCAAGDLRPQPRGSGDGSWRDVRCDLPAVTLPLIAPGDGRRAFCLLSRCRSTISSSRVSPSGPGSTTLPMRIYSQVRLGVTPEINAISTLMLAVVGIVLLSVAALSRRRAQ